MNGPDKVPRLNPMSNMKQEISTHDGGIGASSSNFIDGGVIDNPTGAGGDIKRR